MEASDGPLSGTAKSAWKAQKALEEAGVIIIDEDELGLGVRRNDRDV